MCVCIYRGEGGGGWKLGLYVGGEGFKIPFEQGSALAGRVLSTNPTCVSILPPSLLAVPLFLSLSLFAPLPDITPAAAAPSSPTAVGVKLPPPPPELPFPANFLYTPNNCARILPKMQNFPIFYIFFLMQKKSLFLSLQTMSDKEKKRFYEMAEKDKKRYDAEMQNYIPPKGENKGRGKKRKHIKDPNAPKRSLWVFSCFVILRWTTIIIIIILCESQSSNNKLSFVSSI